MLGYTLVVGLDLALCMFLFRSGQKGKYLSDVITKKIKRHKKSQITHQAPAPIASI